MHLASFPPLFAGIFGVSIGDFAAIVIPIAGIVLAGVVAVSAMYFHHRRREMWHETARIALEKGQPVPPLDPHEEAEKAEYAKDRTADHDLRGGMVLIAVGAGLWLMLGAIAPNARYIGAIPGFIGIALLLYALLTRKNRQPPQDPPARS
ncbi:MAG: DUF6249 domain-containing protein [Verrucomicrobia bacterium]|nr:DUF6249 domain-containing protein [Verrucomicrobiota bacterium]